MLYSFFLALLEDRIRWIHFSNEGIELSFEDLYDSPFHDSCLCLYEAIVTSFK